MQLISAILYKRDGGLRAKYNENGGALPKLSKSAQKNTELCISHEMFKQLVFDIYEGCQNDKLCSSITDVLFEHKQQMVGEHLPAPVSELENFIQQIEMCGDDQFTKNIVENKFDSVLSKLGGTQKRGILKTTKPVEDSPVKKQIKIVEPPVLQSRQYYATCAKRLHTRLCNLLREGKTVDGGKHIREQLTIVSQIKSKLFNNNYYVSAKLARAYHETMNRISFDKFDRPAVVVSGAFRPDNKLSVVVNDEPAAVQAVGEEALLPFYVRGFNVRVDVNRDFYMLVRPAMCSSQKRRSNRVASELFGKVCKKQRAAKPVISREVDSMPMHRLTSLIESVRANDGPDMYGLKKYDAVLKRHNVVVKNYPYVPNKPVQTPKCKRVGDKTLVRVMGAVINISLVLCALNIGGATAACCNPGSTPGSYLCGNTSLVSSSGRNMDVGVMYGCNDMLSCNYTMPGDNTYLNMIYRPPSWIDKSEKPFWNECVGKVRSACSRTLRYGKSFLSVFNYASKTCAVEFVNAGRSQRSVSSGATRNVGFINTIFGVVGMSFARLSDDMQYLTMRCKTGIVNVMGEATWLFSKKTSLTCKQMHGVQPCWMGCLNNLAIPIDNETAYIRLMSDMNDCPDDKSMFAYFSPGTYESEYGDLEEFLSGSLPVKEVSYYVNGPNKKRGERSLEQTALDELRVVIHSTVNQTENIAEIVENATISKFQDLLGWTKSTLNGTAVNWLLDAINVTLNHDETKKAYTANFYDYASKHSGRIMVVGYIVVMLALMKVGVPMPMAILFAFFVFFIVPTTASGMVDCHNDATDGVWCRGSITSTFGAHPANLIKWQWFKYGPSSNTTDQYVAKIVNQGH